MKETPIIGLPDQTGNDSAASIYTHSHRNHRPLSTMEMDRCVPGNLSCFKDFFFFFLQACSFVQRDGPFGWAQMCGTLSACLHH